MSERLIIYTDGGARGNPGPAAAAAIIKSQDHQLISKESRYLGKATNNQAEYQAVILALEKAKSLGAKVIDFYLDSELVVNQLNQNFKVKDLDLQSLFVKIWNLSQNFKKVTYHHIPRTENKEADYQVNLKLDQITKNRG